MSNKQKSGIMTAVIMLIIALVLISFGYDPPDPPIPEEGVEVNVGNSDFGEGIAPQPASPATSSSVPPATQQQVATQSSEPSVSMPSTPVQGNVTPTPQTPTVTPTPEINRNALFPGRRNQGDGSQGQSTGSGDQGSPAGTPNSNNYDAGGGGAGGSWSLAGRSAVSLPKPNYQSNQQGKIVIDIWVDRQGVVTRVDGPAQGSTITNSAMVEQAKAAARKARFNADTQALDEQKGTITYIFKIA